MKQARDQKVTWCDVTSLEDDVRAHEIHMVTLNRA